MSLYAIITSVIIFFLTNIYRLDNISFTGFPMVSFYTYIQLYPSWSTVAQPDFCTSVRVLPETRDLPSFHNIRKHMCMPEEGDAICAPLL